MPGAGAEVAGTWLDTLSAAARGGCVVALPFADADLVALARGKLTDLTGPAVADGRAVVTEILGTPVLDATTWPSGGVLDEAALAGVAAAGTRTVVLDADAVDGGEAGETGGAVPVTVGPTSMVAVLTDTLLTRAAAAPDTPASMGGGTATTVSAAATSPPLATQDAAATLVFRALARQGQPVSGGPPIVLAPPHVWNTDETGARALLATVDLLLDSGRLRVRGLADVVSAGPTTPGPARQAADPLQAGSRDIPPTVLESVREMRADVLDLRSAAVPETGVGASVDATFTPLTAGRAAARLGDLARPPGSRDRGGHGGGRPHRGAAWSVRVLPPPSPYSLGTTDAPLLLTVANGLPVTMEVRLSISSTTGLRVAPIAPQRIPPLGGGRCRSAPRSCGQGSSPSRRRLHSPAGRRARSAEPPAGALHRLRHDHRVADGSRGGAARRAGGVPGGAPDPRRTGSAARAGRVPRSAGPPDHPGPPVPEPPTSDSRTTERRPSAAGRDDSAGARAGAADAAGSATLAPRDPEPTCRRPRADPPPVTHPDRSAPRVPVGSGRRRSADQRAHGGREPGQPASPGSCGRSRWSPCSALSVVNDSYTVANTLPNIVYELLLGGVLTSVMVPLLMRAQTEDADGGEAYTRRLLTWPASHSPSRPRWRWPPRRC